MFGRFHSGKGLATPIPQSHMRSPPEPFMNLQNPLLTKENQGAQNTAARVFRNTLGLPNMPPSVQERALGAAAETTLAQGPVPHLALSEHPDKSNSTGPRFPAESRERIHMGTPAQAAESSHVGEAPFTASSLASSSSLQKLHSWRDWLRNKRD